ncbi:MAG: DUF349 domain-containing protein [Flavobacteriaceae bacterium]|nr:DUF349 domain-containing protein [Flavobacteriaceae bacterium]
MLENNTEDIPADEIKETTAENKDEKIKNIETEKAEVEEVKEDPLKAEVEEVKEVPPKAEVEEVKEVPPKKEVSNLAKEKKLDYSSLGLEGLVNELQKLLRVEAVYQVKNQVEEIKKNFNQKFGTLLKEKKKAFVEQGGNEIDFQFSSPIKSQYNDLLFEFKIKRDRYYKQQEALQKENLAKRLSLIDELKELIDTADASTMYNNFRSLQDRWRAVGKIPHSKYNDVWRTYHHHVERFYDLLHLNKDFRELDYKHNLEEKMKLVEKAEALAEEENINKAFKELQVLHRLWKEDIGPVDREHREEVWGRFSEATKKIHNKRHDAQKELDSKFEENLVKKQAVIEEIKQLATIKATSHSEWQKKIRELDQLRQNFFKIGRVPRSKNNQNWQDFKDATRDFNRAKNAFYKEIKKVQQENLNKKMVLVEKAESLKDKDDWDTVTPVMKQIQIDWKSIGHVPKRYSDEIWKRFKDACNHYFDRLHGVQDEANKEQIEIFNKKKELLENLKSQADKDEALTLEVIQTYSNDWKNLGYVPANMRHIESKFNRLLDKLYGKLNMSRKEIAMLKFKNIVDGYAMNKQIKKLEDEQYFIRKKIDESTREIQQLENNISFISSDSDDNPLLKNVQNNINTYTEDLKIWKEKLDYLSNLKY